MGLPDRDRGPVPELVDRRAALATGVALAGAGALAAVGDPHPRALLGAGVMVVWGVAVALLAPRSPRLAALVVAAVGVRALLIAVPAAWSDDVYRYVWEGRVWLAGRNPFTLAPDAPELAPLRDALWARVNHRAVSSIYPPLAQALFVLVAPLGVPGWKVLSGLADVGTAVLLHRRSPRAGWLWALLPLPALESAGSGHLEGIGVFLLVGALGGRPAWAWAGAMVKLLPGVLLPRLLGRSVRGWLGVCVASLVVFLPILAAGEGAWRGFETYRQTWAYNASLHLLAERVLPASLARPLLQLLGASVALVALRRVRDPGRFALVVTGAFVLLSPTVHPWYVLWPLAAALWVGAEAWVVLAVGVPLAYVVLGTYDAETSSWREPIWPRLVFYPAFYASLLAGALRRLLLPGPWPVH